jgi:hypothetical protein
MKNKFVFLFGITLLAVTAGNPAKSNLSGFCESLSKRIPPIQNQLADMLNKLEQRGADRKTNLNESWTNYQNALNNQQNKQNKDFSADADKLNQRAKTDAEKTAVSAFIRAIHTAITTRRLAVKTALDVFHGAVTAAMESNKAAVLSSIKGSADALTIAFNKAEADCASGSIQQKIRTNLISAMQSAKSSFVSARSKDDISSQMKQLVTAKNAALEKAHQDFRAAVIAARDTLKAILGSSNSTSTQP